jgi:hypothetical protein
MTTAQVVRRKFKSALPRTVPNRELSKMEALARTMELMDKFRNAMRAAELSETDVACGLVYWQPETPGMENVVEVTIPLPAPEQIGTFCNAVMALDRPVFLGVLFIQTDRDPDIKPEKRYTIFALPFMDDPGSARRLLAARQRGAKEVKMN